MFNSLRLHKYGHGVKSYMKLDGMDDFGELPSEVCRFVKDFAIEIKFQVLDLNNQGVLLSKSSQNFVWYIKFDSSNKQILLCSEKSSDDYPNCCIYMGNITDTNEHIIKICCVNNVIHTSLDNSIPNSNMVMGLQAQLQSAINDISNMPLIIGCLLKTRKSNFLSSKILYIKIWNGLSDIHSLPTNYYLFNNLG